MNDTVPAWTGTVAASSQPSAPCCSSISWRPASPLAPLKVPFSLHSIDTYSHVVMQPVSRTHSRAFAGRPSWCDRDRFCDHPRMAIGITEEHEELRQAV